MKEGHSQGILRDGKLGKLYLFHLDRPRIGHILIILSARIQQLLHSAESFKDSPEVLGNLRFLHMA